MEMRVSGKTPTLSLAGAICGAIESQVDSNESVHVSLLCLGSASVNQAVKAIASAGSMLDKKKYGKIITVPYFETMKSSTNPYDSLSRIRINLTTIRLADKGREVEA